MPNESHLSGPGSQDPSVSRNPVFEAEERIMGALAAERMLADTTSGESHVKDPLAALAPELDKLFLGNDPSIPDDKKQERLSQAVDNYFDLIVSHDRKAFPDTGETPKRGVPDYIPDGFMDMGSSSSFDRGEYGRPIIHVDKRAVLAKYKGFFTKFLSQDLSRLPQEARQEMLSEIIGLRAHKALSSEEKDVSRNGIERLSEVTWGTCRHIALTSQVLMQAMGIKSLLSKNHKETTPLKDGLSDPDAQPMAISHASNFVKIGDKWRLLDAANPIWRSDGKHKPEDTVWKGVGFDIEGTPDPNTQQLITVQTDYEQRKYLTRNDMYWTVRHDLGV